MKIYVASKFERKPQVRDAIKALRLAGHTVVGDWTSHTVEGESKEDTEALLEAFAKEDRDAVEEAGGLLLIHDDNCRGGFTELGIALGCGGKAIAVLGGIDKAPTKGPIFYALPEVAHLETLAEAVDFFTESEEEQS